MMRDSTEFRQRFAAWKSGKKVYDAGKPILKYDTGSDNDQPVTEYYTEKDLDKLFNTYDTPFINNNNFEVSDRDSWNSPKNDPERRKILTEWINELMTNDKVSVAGGELENVVVTPTKQDKKILNLFKKAVPNKQIRNTIYKDLDNEYVFNKTLSQNEKVRNIVSIWQMSGNPSTYNGIFDFFQRYPDTMKKRPNYNMWNNSMGNIENLDDYLAELSHAYQFSKYAPKKVRENQITRFSSLPGDIKINGKNGYSRPGNTEYNAHSIIEPAMVDYIRYEKYPSVQSLNDRIDSAFFKSIKPLPKYDGGTDDNPWIPKGAKVPTQNSQEVRVSVQPKTTEISKNSKSVLDTATDDTKILRKKNIMMREALKGMEDNWFTKGWSFLSNYTTLPIPSPKTVLPLIQGVATGLYQKDRQRLLNGAQADVSGDIPNMWHFITNTPVDKEERFDGVYDLNAEKIAPSDTRSLVKLSVLGDDKGFTKYEGDPLKVNGETYDYLNQYVGQIFPYKQLPVPPQVYQLLHQYSNDKKLLQMPDNLYYGKGDKTYDVIDNVARHGASIKRDGEQLYYSPFDVWDYSGDYIYSIVPYMNDLFQSAIAPNENFPNSGAFVLRQDIPIVVDSNAYKNPAFKGFVSAVRGSDKRDEQLYKILEDYMTQNADGFPLNMADENVNFDIDYDKGKSIHINPANKGKFNATKKRTGKTTEQLAHSKNPLTRKRAIFALNARKWKH